MPCSTSCARRLCVAVYPIKGRLDNVFRKIRAPPPPIGGRRERVRSQARHLRVKIDDFEEAWTRFPVFRSGLVHGHTVVGIHSCFVLWCGAPCFNAPIPYYSLLKEHPRDIGRIGAPQRVPSQWYLRSRGTMAVYGAAFYWPCRRAMPGPERSTL
jgi:hypothetical protein